MFGPCYHGMMVVGSILVGKKVTRLKMRVEKKFGVEGRPKVRESEKREKKSFGSYEREMMTCGSIMEEKNDYGRKVK